MNWSLAEKKQRGTTLRAGEVSMAARQPPSLMMSLNFFKMRFVLSMMTFDSSGASSITSNDNLWFFVNADNTLICFLVSSSKCVSKRARSSSSADLDNV